MNTSRKRKIETAQALLKQQHTNILQCLTAAELDTLKKHKFDIEAYANNNSAVIVTTNNEADEHEIDRIISKLSAEQKRLNADERTTIHLSKHIEK